MSIPGQGSGCVRAPSDESLEQIRERVTAQINAHPGQLFTNQPDKFNLYLIEGYSGDSQCNPLEITHPNAFRDFIDSQSGKKELEPMVRHIFFSAGNSTKPLKCTTEAFQLLCTKLRILPEFVEMIMSFGQFKEEIVPFHQPQCYQEHSVMAVPRPGPVDPVDTLEGLSNLYKLSGVEPSVQDGLVIRQMAVHHSFNFLNGQCTFVSIKARHKELSNKIGSLSNNSVPNTIPASFAYSLQVQLIGFRWSVQGWQAHLTSLEQQVRYILLRANSISQSRGEKEYKDNYELLRIRTMRPTGNHQPAVPSSKTFGPESFKRIGSTFSDILHNREFTTNVKSPQKSKLASVEKEEDEKKAKEDNAQLEKQSREIINNIIDRMALHKEFPFDGLQTLSSASQKLKEAKLVMGLNAKVLQETREYYQELFNSTEFPSLVKRECAKNCIAFQRELKHLEKQMSSECMRAEVLMQLAGDAKNMYHSILNLQSADNSTLFAMDSVGTSIKMEKSTNRMEQVTMSMHEIARNTERDTASMHVITFFALVFLPGTFLASLFSTPIFDEPKRGGNKTWDFNWPLFHLFWMICGPMMIFLIILWGVYLYMQRRPHGRQLPPDEERASGGEGDNDFA